MRVPFVDLGRHNILLANQFRSAFERVLFSGRYLMGHEVEIFETELAALHTARHAVAVGSGSDACELALRAAYDEGAVVATPAFGAVPTISAIEAAGCRPVLVDVDPVTRGVSFDTLAQVRTEGAIVVHMFGQLCDVPRNAIEDCAHAQGAGYNNIEAGQRGISAALSFFPTKCLGGLADGGAVLTDNPQVAARVRAIRHYGGLLDGDVTMRGQNSRMSELHAALLREKLGMLRSWNNDRRRIAKRYRTELADKVKVPTERPGDAPSYHCFVIEYDERDRLKRDLEERGVITMVHYSKPIHFYRRWRGLGAPGDFQVSERLAATVLSLPCFPGLTEEEQTHVIASVRACT